MTNLELKKAEFERWSLNVGILKISEKYS